MAESKRITRGIQLNQQFSSNFPSFNLCITQEIADNVGSAAKMMEERRSKYCCGYFVSFDKIPHIWNHPFLGMYIGMYSVN